jgi:hypothetical protein
MMQQIENFGGRQMAKKVSIFLGNLGIGCVNQKKHGGLGFRKYKDFNLALLAKVAWKVATNHNSLCVKLLKSKYKI